MKVPRDLNGEAISFKVALRLDEELKWLQVCRPLAAGPTTPVPLHCRADPRPEFAGRQNSSRSNNVGPHANSEASGASEPLQGVVVGFSGSSKLELWCGFSGRLVGD